MMNKNIPYITLDKIVSLSTPLNSKFTKNYTCRYKDLEKELKNYNEIHVSIIHCERERREKQLCNIGFKIKEIISECKDKEYFFSMDRIIFERI